MRIWEGFQHGINFWRMALAGRTFRQTLTKLFLDKKPYFAVAARWGLDHVRIPVDYELVETEGGIQKKADFNGSHSALHGAENMVCT